MIFGLLGRSLSHSLSPQLHGMIYEHTGISATYNLFQVEPERVGEVIPALRALGIRGVNVTIPYKQEILPFLDGLSPEAQAIGAVNTVLIREDGGAWGYNTDYYGFAQSLARQGIQVKGKRVVLCGMSGAGRAVYRALADGGAAEITVASTDPAKGIAYDKLKELPAQDLIVNCTPVGMHPHSGQSVVDEAVLSRFGAAADIVYNPLQTEFLRLAQEQGLQTANGLYMLIYQGIRAFSIWTGTEPEDALAGSMFDRLKGQFFK